MTMATIACSGEASNAAQRLFALGERYGTDKVQHGFLPIYARHINASAVKPMLEVGVFRAASLRMWRDFLPHAQVYGIDGFTGVMGNGQRVCDGSCVNEARDGALGPRCHLLRADQANATQMRDVVLSLQRDGVALDVIIEDGSHMHRDQQLSLALLLPLVRPGGLYVIEDLHSSFAKGYDEPPRSSRTSYAVVSHFRASGRFVSRHVSAAQAAYLESWIASAEAMVGEGGGRDDPSRRTMASSSICLIRKRTTPIERAVEASTPTSTRMPHTRPGLRPTEGQLGYAHALRNGSLPHIAHASRRPR